MSITCIVFLCGAQIPETLLRMNNYYWYEMGERCVFTPGALSSSLTEGSRTIRMDETFFTGYRKTVLKPQEILLSVEIPYSRQVR